MVLFFEDSLVIPARRQHPGACQSLHRGPQRAGRCHYLLLLAVGTSGAKPASCSAARGACGMNTAFSVSRGDYVVAVWSNMQYAEGGGLSQEHLLRLEQQQHWQDKHFFHRQGM